MPAPEPLPAFDPYRELGVDRWSTTSEIEHAWRTRMRAAHPDAAGSDGDPRTAARRTAQAARLNVARDWLTDPVRRGRYDEVRFGGSGRETAPPDPSIDPLGAWPDRPPRPTGPGPGVFAAIGLMAVLYALVVGVGASVLSAAAFAMGSILIVFYGLLAVLGLFRSR